MTSIAIPRTRDGEWREWVPAGLGTLAFLVLYWAPASTLVQQWWTSSESGHGLLLAPLAVWLAWRRGVALHARPQRRLGLALLVGAVVLRYGAGLAAELLTMRLSLFGAVAALIVYRWGIRQVMHWWLPVGLMALSIPLPAVVLGSLALPLQLQATEWGAAMLEWRQVPVLLSGNVLHLPGRTLFVTEACSGLRSLTALLALGLLIGGVWLRTVWGRVFLIGAAIPVAMVLNSLRIFLTAFLTYFVSPSLGEGVMHYSEGWGLFVVAFLLLCAIAAGVLRIELLRSKDRT